MRERVDCVGNKVQWGIYTYRPASHGVSLYRPTRSGTACAVPNQTLVPSGPWALVFHPRYSIGRNKNYGEMLPCRSFLPR